MTRNSAPIRLRHVLLVLLSFTLAGCSEAQGTAEQTDAGVEAPRAPSGGQGGAPYDGAASVAAASVAMGEACDFSSTDINKMKAQLAPGADIATAGEFDAAIARHMPHARTQVAAQQRQAGAAWARNCESARSFLQN